MSVALNTLKKAAVLDLKKGHLDKAVEKVIVVLFLQVQFHIFSCKSWFAFQL